MNQDTVANISQGGEKPTNEELNARIDDIVDMLGKGWRRRDIAKYLAKNTSWNISARTLDRLIRRAKALLGKSGRQKADFVLDMVLYRLNSIYFQAMQDKNYAAALDSVESMCRLFHLPIAHPAGRASNRDDHDDRRIAVLITPAELARAQQRRTKQIPSDPGGTNA